MTAHSRCPVVIADLIGCSKASRPLSATTTTSTVDSSVMGRTPTKSVARVYADVNAKLGPSWHEYGAAAVPLVDSLFQPLTPLSKTICRSSGGPKTIMRLFAK